MPGFAFPAVGPLGFGSPPSRPTPQCADPRYYAQLRPPLPVSGRFAWRSLPDTLSASLLFVSRFRFADPLEARRSAPGLLVCRYPSSSGSYPKETGGSPKFPSCPSKHMPRSQTPVVSRGLAMAPPGLLPSGASKPSAFPRLSGLSSCPQLYIFRGSITRPAPLLHPASHTPSLE